MSQFEKRNSAVGEPNHRAELHDALLHLRDSLVQGQRLMGDLDDTLVSDRPVLDEERTSNVNSIAAQATAPTQSRFMLQFSTPRGKAILNRLLPLGDSSFPLLGFIDPYGDTIFNGVQMQLFLQEWDRLLKKTVNEDYLHLLRQIRSSAERCESGTHLYVRFIGD